MDLSKAYDCLPHDLLIAKLATYGSDNMTFALITDYLINSNFQTFYLNGYKQRQLLAHILKFSEMFQHQGQSYLTSLMFFIKKREVYNFADDTAIYSCSLNYEEPHRKLSGDTHIIPNQFRVNSMVANPGKFQIIFLRSSINSNIIITTINNKKIIFIVENKHIKSNNEVKILGITTYHKLAFTKDINNLCNTTCKTFEDFDKNKEIFISSANKTSF